MAAVGASQMSTDQRWAQASAWLLASALQAGLLYVWVERPAYARLLGPALPPAQGLLVGAIVGGTMLFAWPALVVATASSWLGRRRLAATSYGLLATSGILYVAVDLDVYQSVGRHLAGFWSLARLSADPQLVGESTRWGLTLIKWLLVSAALSLGTAWIAYWSSSRLARILTPLLRGVVYAALWLLLTGVSAVPLFLHPLWHEETLVERLYGIFPVDWRIGSAQPRDRRFADPVLDTLQTELSRRYREAFPLVFAPHAAPSEPLPILPSRPNVILIVAESFRRDALEDELMPRLSRWSRKGLRALFHDSGSMYSEAGMFGLLYGRSPLVYHATLDARVRPPLCELLRKSGYLCAYYSGQPRIWWRSEEFLDRHTMDRFEHDDTGRWYEWDQKALRKMVRDLEHPDKPCLAIVFLMSSHFEYQYPPEYEIDKPVAKSTLGITNVRSLGPDDALPHRNRYRNSMRFLDDLVGNALEGLDPARNLVILTGDHGESIYDDGRYTNGYSFAEVITRVPFVMVGPGVPPGQMTSSTVHWDLLPTVAHALTGHPVALPHAQGLDLLAPSSERRALLLAHDDPNQDVADAQLRAGGHRLRLRLGLRRPTLLVQGFEDELGRWMARPALSGADTALLLGAFQHELDTMRR
jgi:hypothetical protein